MRVCKANSEIYRNEQPVLLSLDFIIPSEKIDISLRLLHREDL